jgi:uncharacterized protein HemY
MSSIHWQDEVTPEQWNIWLKFAQSLSKSKKVNTSLGAEDYAAQAIELLLQQVKRPANVEGWLAHQQIQSTAYRFPAFQLYKVNLKATPTP